MKFYLEYYSLGSNISKNLWLKMKMLSLFLFIALLPISATTLSQTIDFDNEFSGSKLNEFISFVEEETSYKFFLSSSEIDTQQEVSKPIGNVSVTEALDKVFTQLDINYQVSGDHSIMLLSNNMQAEEGRMITGKVSDDAGLSIPGVSVVKKGTTTGTITDMDGKYSLANVKSGDILIFSFVGMASQQIAVGSQSTIDITLKQDAIGLEEVVAVGYGSMKKANLTGATSMVKAEAFEDRPVQNATQALQGQVPGLNISQVGGAPGNEKLNVQIRGLNSYGSSNTPLVLIDGVEGNLADLDPSVIESVSVLKDAASAAIYGLRAANGVILIQTKKGSTIKNTVTYDGSYAISNPTMMPDMITNSVDFMNLFNQSITNNPGKSGLTPYPQEIINAYGANKGEFLYPNTDWVDLVTQQGTTQKHSIGISGSAEDTRYNIVLSTWQQEGVMKTSEYNKNNIYINLQTNLNKYIEVGTVIMGMASDRVGPNDAWSNPLTAAWKVRPTWGPYTADGNLAGKAFSGSENDPDGFMHDEGFTRENPLGPLYGQKGYSDNKYNFNGNLFLRANITKNLEFFAKGAYKFDYTKSKFQRLQFKEYNYRTGEFLRVAGSNPPEIQANNEHWRTTTFYSTLTYNKNINDHGIKAMGGISIESRLHEWTNSSRLGVVHESLTELDGAGTDTQATDGSMSESAVRSFFGRINYDYKDKYLLEVNVRADESSRFAQGNRLGVFPSVSAGWRLDQEGFMQDSDWFDQLKLRGSWGQLGNDGNNDYAWQSIYSFGSKAPVPHYTTSYYSGTYGYPFGNGVDPGVVMDRLVDPNITWETTTITDIGADISIKNALLTLNVDYYSKVTSDILRRLQVSQESGVMGPQVNSGEMKNTGWDFVLGHNYTIGKFKYSISGNLSWYKNEMTKFGATEINDRNINEEGYPYNDFYMYQFDGFFDTQEEIDNAPDHPLEPYLGGIKVKDISGPDGVPDGVIDGDDRVHIDGQHPDFFYGFNLSASYAGFDLSMFWQGVSGQKSYLMDHGIEPFTQDGNSAKMWLTEAWTPENKDAQLPAVYHQSDMAQYNGKQFVNSFWLRNTSYFRLKNLTLGYSLPKSVISKIKLDKVRVYFSGDNLLTFMADDLFGIDPEVKTSYNYPNTKVYTMGLTVSF
ncbi:TonB-dependent receptor [Saccharicrinis aurantiacus]|uniref:TonB-dependent receptor n=1 Tax=Saccharicrinis aurantiacus TaxID=1849719 RepID=UPI0024939BB3|nr:TonB-dependent receptor [Saccharicrinis aurantiacus]